jgi:hypothetical protein
MNPISNRHSERKQRAVAQWWATAPRSRRRAAARWWWASCQRTSTSWEGQWKHINAENGIVNII